MSVEEVQMLTGRILVDTNVLIYATLAADPRHECARLVLDQRHRPDVEMFISVQNLAEMYPNLTGPKNQPPDSPALASDKIRSLARLRGLTVLPLTLETTYHTLELCVDAAITRQAYFDTQLVALMLHEGIPLILTENISDFTKFANIRALNPFD